MYGGPVPWFHWEREDFPRATTRTLAITWFRRRLSISYTHETPTKGNTAMEPGDGPPSGAMTGCVYTVIIMITAVAAAGAIFYLVRVISQS